MDICDGWKIEVLNWRKYNPRTDSKIPTWFRLENDFALGPGFFDLRIEHKWLWVIILSLASKKNGAPFTWNSAFVNSISGINPTIQLKGIEMFEQFVRLRVTRKVTLTSAPATNETDETDETKKGPPPSAPPILSEFEEIREVLISRKIPVEVQTLWLQSYPDPPWVISRIRRMVAWETENGRKKQKFSAFAGRWLAKDWDKRPPSVKAGINTSPLKFEDL